MPTLDVRQLTVQERIDLIGELCDSLEAEDAALTPAQEAEIERRLTTAEADIARGKTWDQIEAELDRRYS